MSNINFEDAFLRAIEPEADDLYAYNSTLKYIDQHIQSFSEIFIPTLKNPDLIQVPVVYSNMSNILLDFDNWWRHTLKERIEQDLVLQFGEKAQQMNVTVMDCVKTENQLTIDMKCEGSLTTSIYGLQDFVPMETHQDLSSQNGFKTLRSLCNKIGGIKMGVILNMPTGQNLPRVERPEAPTLLVSTVDNAPLLTKIQRFEEHGPVH